MLSALSTNKESEREDFVRQEFVQKHACVLAGIVTVVIRNEAQSSAVDASFVVDHGEVRLWRPLRFAGPKPLEWGGVVRGEIGASRAAPRTDSNLFFGHSRRCLRF